MGQLGLCCPGQGLQVEVDCRAVYPHTHMPLHTCTRLRPDERTKFVIHDNSTSNAVTMHLYPGKTCSVSQGI